MDRELERERGRWWEIERAKEEAKESLRETNRYREVDSLREAQRYIERHRDTNTER